MPTPMALCSRLATSLFGPRVGPHLVNFKEMYGVAQQDAEAAAKKK